MRAIRFSLPALLLAAAAMPAAAASIDLNNGLTAGTVGAVSVSINEAGELDSYDVTGENVATGGTITEQVIFDYFAIFNTGADSGDLGDTFNMENELIDGAVVSSGSFSGDNGVINWRSTSRLEAGTTRYSTQYDFEAENGFGDVFFSQYLDEDIEAVSDDVAFVLGLAASDDLELYTIDGETGLGVGQSGSFTEASGLIGATFVGFAIDAYNDLQGDLRDGTRTQSVDIDVDELGVTTSTFTDATVYGPNDIVSALTWRLDPSANRASIVTTLGGVVDLVSDPTIDGGDINPGTDPEPEPEPMPTPDTGGGATAVPTPSAAVGGLALLGLAAARRRRGA